VGEKAHTTGFSHAGARHKEKESALQTIFPDAFVKSQTPAFRSWFDTCLTDGRQASPRTENQIVTVHRIRSP
jgi:hypothetical protein